MNRTNRTTGASTAADTALPPKSDSREGRAANLLAQRIFGETLICGKKSVEALKQTAAEEPKKRQRR